ncbi:MAG: 2-C-methyl-D-erythritol 4-phosphate cytidylyltransferase [Prevotellaceae bacterium]|nr:2-C-methyl-D-erythritol 4-phosphate cytidylyltransferase [Prevotellaceae bacterium]
MSLETISRCFDRAEQCGAAIPVIALNESIRFFENEEKRVSVSMEKYRSVQTQLFNSEILLRAYEQSYSKDFTDDASVVEKSGYLSRRSKVMLKISS